MARVSMVVSGFMEFSFRQGRRALLAQRLRELALLLDSYLALYYKK